MGPSYSFAVFRLAPDDGRDERINIGAVVFGDEALDVRWARRIDKVRAISAAVDTSTLRELLEGIRALDLTRVNRGELDAESRLCAIKRIGPISMSELGTFVAEDAAAYEGRIESILKHLVDAERAPPRVRDKRSKLLTQLKREFRRERVLATKEETLDSHRVVTKFELDEGLIADLALKNGAMHVIETVDASADDEPARSAISDIGVSALVLERARMKFGEKGTRTRLVYAASATLERVTSPALEAASHQGAQLINWLSAADRMKFLGEISSLAEPIPRKRGARRAQGTGQRFSFGD